MGPAEAGRARGIHQVAGGQRAWQRPNRQARVRTRSAIAISQTRRSSERVTHAEPDLVRWARSRRVWRCGSRVADGCGMRHAARAHGHGHGGVGGRTGRPPWETKATRGLEVREGPETPVGDRRQARPPRGFPQSRPPARAQWGGRRRRESLPGAWLHLLGRGGAA